MCCQCLFSQPVRQKITSPSISLVKYICPVGSPSVCYLQLFLWLLMQEEPLGEITLELILTPPTLSKWSPSFSKSIRCPLNDQVNTMSSEWSWDTWQGRTILSPTVTSMLKGDTITRVGSTNEENGGENINPLLNWDSCGAESTSPCNPIQSPSISTQYTATTALTVGFEKVTVLTLE